MKGKLKTLAPDYDLDETVYVRWVEDKDDDRQVVLEAHDKIDNLLDPDEKTTVVGVYKLVGIEEVTRISAVTTRKLA